MNSDSLVEHCIDVLGPLKMLDSTVTGLKSYASKFGEMSWANSAESKQFDEATVAIIQLVVSSQEYQTV